MMVDADEHTVFQTFEPGPVDAVAFQDNCSLVAAHTRLDCTT